VLNGLMMANVRGFYSLAIRGKGYNPKMFCQVDPVTNMPSNASIMGLLIAGWWLLYFYGANLTSPWFGPFCFDTSELPIITIYAMYIPLFLVLIKKIKNYNITPIIPVIAILGSLFMVIAAIFAHRMAVVFYLIVFAAVIIVGLPRMNAVPLDKLKTDK
jgi:APA family basic amino acid/polyamine antiporter